MVTSPNTLCLRHVLQHVRLACRCSVDAVHALRRELVCLLEPEVGCCRRLVQRKRHTVGILTVL